MLTPTTPLTLCMIVKDEARVIERCLRSVKPYIHRWVIVDTGSTDETKTKITAALEGVPGEVVDRPWVDFGHNRSEALDIARNACGGNGYILVIDADDTFVAPPDWSCPPLDRDSYTLLHKMNAVTFHRAQIFSAALPWEYVGVVHEYPKIPGRQATTEMLHGVWVEIGQDGARRQSNGRMNYLQDAELLKKAVADNPDDLRSLFYLAQSYRDAGEPSLALDYYRQRAAAKGWEEERWYALFQSGVMAYALGLTEKAIVTLEKAFEERPQRREPVVMLATIHRLQKHWSRARLWSHYAVTSPSNVASEKLFVEPACYGGWRALDELSLATYNLNNTVAARALFQQLLDMPTLPAAQRSRVLRNLKSMTSTPGGKPFPLHANEINISPRLSDLHTRYTKTVSTEVMALSKEASAFLMAFTRREYIQRAIDLGSGLSSAVLRLTVDQVTSVDTDPEWLAKTCEFVAALGLEGKHETALWSEFKPTPDYELVVLDMAHTDERSQYLPMSWELIAPGGWLFIDDMHHWPYHDKVEKFLGLIEHRLFDVHAHTLDRYGRYGWLVQKPKNSTGGHSDQRVIVGVGTGRCGTASLAALLDKQADAFVTHEYASPLSWTADPETISQQLSALKQRPFSFVGDVGPYYLPHIEQLLEDPKVTIIGLRRPKDETVNSLLGWTKNKNHWINHDGVQWTRDPWDVAFPQFLASSKKEALEKYWDHYYERLATLAQRFVGRVHLFELETLNHADGVLQLLYAAGFQAPRVITAMHRNQRLT